MSGNQTAIDWQWPAEGIARVPYRVYADQALYERERERLFMGETWSYLCLEAELAEPKSFRTSHVGDVPVVVTRDAAGVLHGFENRCAHRGNKVCIAACGRADDLTCVYHGWRYGLDGKLLSVAFARGVKGKGGMPADFRREDHNLRPLRVESFAGLVLGTFSADAPSLADYIGPEIGARVRRIFNRPVKVLGRVEQALPNNWKLYVENVKDSYHASILHLFFTTFRINRLSQSGGIVLDDTGGHHVSYSKIEPGLADDRYAAERLRADHGGFELQDGRLLETVDEFGDGITLQILSLFPNFVIQQIQNSLAVRQVVPQGIGRALVVWTYFGFEDDPPEMEERRVLQGNLVGPAGYVSMEDGAVGGFIQQAIRGSASESAVLEMGGRGAESQDTRATEASVRGFWQRYRALMGL